MHFYFREIFIEPFFSTLVEIVFFIYKEIITMFQKLLKKLAVVSAAFDLLLINNSINIIKMALNMFLIFSFIKLF